MEWCGSRAEEFGDWPDKLAVSAYTRYVDEYHEKVLEINEMTRQQVNTVFENVAEIDARYAARMRECQEKIKGQIAIVRTMTEFMDSMTAGKPNMALITKGSVNENCVRMDDDDEDEEENTEPIEVIDAAEIFYPGYKENGQQILMQCLINHTITDPDEINKVLKWTMENDDMKLIELSIAGNEDNYNENVERIYQEIMRNYYAATATGGDPNGKGMEFNCYWVRENFSLFDYGTEECLRYMNNVYENGYVGEEDYGAFCYWNGVINHVPSAEADKIRNMMQECLDHVVTTVYIYNCLQVLCGVYQTRTFTPEECCEANEIFRYFGIADRNSIACFLICCAGESGGFKSTQEDYETNDIYTESESGMAYLQITLEENQINCRNYIHDIYEKEELIENQAEYSDNLSDYPWTASAWYWAIRKETKDDNLNQYVVARCKDNGGKLTVGIVLTAECFVHGDVKNGLSPALA